MTNDLHALQNRRKLAAIFNDRLKTDEQVQVYINILKVWDDEFSFKHYVMRVDIEKHLNTDVW